MRSAAGGVARPRRQSGPRIDGPQLGNRELTDSVLGEAFITRRISFVVVILGVIVEVGRRAALRPVMDPAGKVIMILCVGPQMQTWQRDDRNRIKSRSQPRPKGSVPAESAALRRLPPRCAPALLIKRHDSKNTSFYSI